MAVKDEKDTIRLEENGHVESNELQLLFVAVLLFINDLLAQV